MLAPSFLPYRSVLRWDCCDAQLTLFTRLFASLSGREQAQSPSSLPYCLLQEGVL